MESSLHKLNPTKRFSSRAAEYARFRPGYPDEAAEALLDGLGPPPTLIAADIGAGTGISSRWLARRGVRIIAIEPNDEMRRAAESHPLVEWRNARAEATTLADSSVHLIVSAQAFHWFDPQPTLAEFARILMPSGRLALVYNSGDRSDPLTAAYHEAVNAAADDPAVPQVRSMPDHIAQSPLFTNPRELTFRHTQTLDEDGLVGRALSASYTPREGPAAKRLEEQLRSAYRRHAPPAHGLTYITRLLLAERSGSKGAQGDPERGERWHNLSPLSGDPP